MTPIDYHCKLCGVGRVAYYDPACPIRLLNAWVSALCCARCYAFRDSYNKTKREIEATCIALINIRQTIRDFKLKREASEKIRERLVAQTQRIVAICSDHYHVQNVWDSEIVGILMDKPDGCNKAINTLRAGYQKQSDDVTC